MSLRKLLPIAALFLAGAVSATPANDPAHAKARELLERTVNIPTTPGSPKLLEMANYLAGEYCRAGFPEADIKVMPYEKVAALIVRWRAPNPSARPIMLMAHMDVVEARREDWGDTDPFVFTEKDGYYYGRGTSDIKQGIAATLAALMKLKAEGGGAFASDGRPLGFSLQSAEKTYAT
ncbi:M20/M25/M40 family metallo-hydrolase [Massilia sp. DD77]|uniref:M20/M25/M40 family metallo-hydrolase n=1 Tax=Massilia sp. DD77 TaxID=3109349 RepID=UPI002FFEF910